MKYNILILFLWISASFVMPLRGQSLNDYLLIAGENNPGLKASYLAYYSALEKVPQVGALPDPQLSFGLFLKPMERYAGNQVADITLMQMFPWFGTNGAARDEARLMAQAMYETFRERRAMVWYDVRTVWWRMWLIKEELRFLDEQIETLQSLEEIAIQRIRGSGAEVTASGAGGSSPGDNMGNDQSAGGMGGMAGMGGTSGNVGSTNASQPMSMPGSMSGMNRQGGGTLSDVLRLQMEINELQVRAEALADELMAQKARFNSLLNRPADTPVEVSEEAHAESDMQIITLDAIYTQNPMLQMARQEELAYEAMERMNRKMGLPMFGVGLQYSVFEPRPGNPNMMNGDNMLMPMVSVSIPIWRRKYNASVREASLLRESAVAEQVDVQNQLTSDYHQTESALRDAERRMGHYARQKELAQQVLNLLIRGYSVSGADFDELVRLQNQLVDYQLQTARAEADRQLALARMALLAGL